MRLFDSQIVWNGNNKMKIEDQKWLKEVGLTWYPWIPDSYWKQSNNQKLLVVGESHYLDSENLEATRKEYSNPTFSQRVIQEQAIDSYPGCPPTFPNFNKMLGLETLMQRKEFWQKTAFYNFIQTPLPGKKVRHNVQERREASLCYLNVLDKLRPSFCLFIGTFGFNNVKREISDSEWKIIDEIWSDKINEAYPRQLVLENNSGQKCHLLFIRHTSRFFSHEKWRAFVREAIPFI